jgi:hypothetical protein
MRASIGRGHAVASVRLPASAALRGANNITEGKSAPALARVPGARSSCAVHVRLATPSSAGQGGWPV